ncbi:MAG: hypothetical protein JWQ21_1524 [Herminiimonas sp.]|nr:hypothetical protein [Herminiimonas sp.]
MDQPGEIENATSIIGRVLFVYYKLDQSQHAALLPLVKDFQQRVTQTWPGISCDLMQRPSASAEGKETWMEIYRHSGPLTDRMIESIALLAQQMQLPAPRLSEIFIPLQ